MQKLVEALKKINCTVERTNIQHQLHGEFVVYKSEVFITCNGKTASMPFYSSDEIVSEEDIFYGIFATINEYDYWDNKDEWMYMFSLKEKQHNETKQMKRAVMDVLDKEQYHKILMLFEEE